MKKLSILLSCLVLLGVASTPVLAQNYLKNISASTSYLANAQNDFEIGANYLVKTPQISKNLKLGGALEFQLPKNDISFVNISGVAQYDLSDYVNNLYIKGALGYSLPQASIEYMTISGGLLYSATVGYNITDAISIEGSYQSQKHDQSVDMPGTPEIDLGVITIPAIPAQKYTENHTDQLFKLKAVYNF